jgi:hypothetical protein
MWSFLFRELARMRSGGLFLRSRTQFHRAGAHALAAFRAGSRHFAGRQILPCHLGTVRTGAVLMRGPYGEHTRLARRRIRRHPDRLATSAHHSLSLGQRRRRTPRSAAHQEQRRSYEEYYLLHTRQLSARSPQRTMGSPPQEDFGKTGTTPRPFESVGERPSKKNRAHPLRRVWSSATFRAETRTHASTASPCRRPLVFQWGDVRRSRDSQRIGLARRRLPDSRDAAP